MRRHSLIAPARCCVAYRREAGRALEFDLIPQDNVLCLITKLFQKEGFHIQEEVLWLLREQVDFLEYHCAV